jgi:dihydroorotate dehydrogenase
MLYRHILGPLLFGLTRRDPEQAHAATIALLAAAGTSAATLRVFHRLWGGGDHPSLARELFGVRFPNPVGLAAGYDKNGTALAALAALGFGFIEVGTVTWHAQPGNPRPRIFRLPAAGALINRMGFNNDGAQAMAANLRRTLPLPIPIGISLGKSRRTPLDEAVDDYCASFRALAPYGDFFTINISSPNTPGLRRLQEREQLDILLAALRRESHALAAEPARARPLLVKIAPDLSDQAIAEVLEVCATHQVDGIIATNTTRVGEGSARPDCESGGLSGLPLAETARHVVHFIERETGGRLPIVGVGGIFTPDDARHMFDAGASLIQVYTGMIYEGPALVGRLKRGLW